jgi:hypothetical protein
MACSRRFSKQCASQIFYRLSAIAYPLLSGVIMRSLLITALLLCPLLAAAAEKLNVKTGLWEITATSDIAGMPSLPKELLDKLPPEQRAEIEASMKQGGAGGPHKEVSRECITERDLEDPFKSANPDECKSQLVRSTRTMQEVKLTCGGQHKGSGSFLISTPTPETMTGVLDVSVGEGDATMKVKADMSGRWLGPDCGEEADDEDDTDADDSEDLEYAEEEEEL